MADAVFTMDHFPQLIAALHAGAIKGVRDAAQAVLVSASEECPVDTGFLRASGYTVTSDASTYGQATGAAGSIEQTRDLLSEVEPPGDDETAVVAYAASYAVFVHEGSRGRAARPWLVNAAGRTNVGEAVAKAITEALDAAG